MKTSDAISAVRVHDSRKMALQETAEVSSAKSPLKLRTGVRAGYYYSPQYPS